MFYAGFNKLFCKYICVFDMQKNPCEESSGDISF